MISLLLDLLCVGLFALALEGCFGPAQNYSTPDPITVSGNLVQVRPGSKFMEQLQVVPLGRAPGGERKLRAVGQMIAMANPSGDLTKNEVSWVTLDPGMSRALRLYLSDTAPIGYAYGATSISSSYRDEIHPGEKVEVYRYGLRQNSATGSVVSVQRATGSESEDSVIFSIVHGQDWYPGTNCQVEFPLIQRQAVALSPLSMLHEGLREFILKEVSPGQYLPEEITVVHESHDETQNGTRDQVYALGDLSPGDRVVERGAILLKPLVHQILEVSKEAPRVR